MNLSPQDLQKLISSIDKLVGAMGGGSARTSSYSSSRTSDGGIDLDKLKASIANNGSITKLFGEQAKKMSMAMKGVSDVYDKLERSTRDQSDAVRKLNTNLADFVSSAKDSTKALEDLKKMSDNVKTVMKSYEADLIKYKKSQQALADLARQRADAEKKVLDAQNSLAKAKKNKKSTKGAMDELNKAQKSLGELNKQFSNQKLVSNNFKRNLDDSVKSLEKYNDLTGALTKEQIKGLKNYKSVNTSQKEYKDTVDALAVSSKHLDDGIGKIADVMDERAKKIANAFDDFKSSMKKAALQLLTVAPKVAFDDFKAQLKNNVNESDYFADARMGVSESERSNIIGENRIGLRQLGNGDEQAGFRGGASELQKAGWQYGLQGADAIKLGLQFQNSMINSGYKGTAKDTANQMTIMHNFAKQIGVTDESLKDYNDSLIQSGKMAELNNKYANLDDAARRKAVNQEIITRAKLNTELGLSIERQKEINQEDVNKKYSGVAATVMRHVGTKMLTHDYNRGRDAKDQITGDRAARLQQYQDTGVMGKDWTPEQVSQVRADKINLLASPANKLNTAAGKGYTPLVAEQARQAGLAATGYDAGTQGVQALNDKAKMLAVKGSKLTTNDSYEDLSKNIIDTTNNAFIPFNKEVMDATQRLHGLAANPLGAAGKTAIGGAASFAGSFGGSLLGSGGGAALSTGVGELAAGGVAGIASIVVGVLAAGTVGIAIGSLVNKYLLTNADGTQTKTGAVIGNSVLMAGASMGIPGTQESLIGQAQGDYFDSDAGKKAREAHRQEFARKFEAKWGHPPDSMPSSVSPSTVKPNLSEFVKLNDDLMGSPHKPEDTLEILKKMQKVLQDQLDLQKKDSDKKAADDSIKSGQTWNQYKDHISEVRKGLGGK